MAWNRGPQPVNSIQDASHPGRDILAAQEWSIVRRVGSLTARQLEVVQASFDTPYRPEIAQMLGVSVHTVDFHLQNAYAKLGVEDRGALMLRCLAIVRNEATREDETSRNRPET